MQLRGIGLVFAFIVSVGLGAGSASGQVFTDDFSDPSLANWDRVCSPMTSCVVESGEFHFNAAFAGYQHAFIKNLQPENFRYEFDYKQVTWAGWMYAWFAQDRYDQEVASGNFYRVSQDGRGWIEGIDKWSTLPAPITINGITYDHVRCLGSQRLYYVPGVRDSGWINQSCWYEPLSNYSSGLYGTGDDNIWHHMIITKLGPVITVEIPDAGYRSEYYDCRPMTGYEGLAVWDQDKHVHYDNVRLEESLWSCPRGLGYRPGWCGHGLR